MTAHPKRPTELPIFTAYYELTLWAFTRADSFPKVLRPTLTTRFLGLHVQVMEGLLELRYTRERPQLFRRVNLGLETMRILSRLLKDRRAFSLEQYAYYNRELDAIGRQLGGWMKQNARRA